MGGVAITDTAASEQESPGSELAWRLLAMLGAALIGILVALAAMGFFAVFSAIGALWQPALPSSLSDVSWSYDLRVGLALGGSALLAGQILRWLPDGRPHGPADLIHAAQQEQAPPLGAGFLSTLLSLISLSGGASVGLFGPLMHFGGCMSALMRRLFLRMPYDVILGIGAGAAVAAVFSAPIGAAILAHEAVIRRFSNYGPAPVLTASFAAYWVASSLLGQQPLFGHVSTEPLLDARTLLQALGLGVLAGSVSIVYILSVTAAPRLGRASGLPPSLRPLLPAVTLFALSPVLPHLLGAGLPVMDSAMAGSMAAGLLVALLLSKIALTSLCLGFGFFGGVFAPALFIGVMLGALFDHFLGGGGGQSTFAMVGAASCIAAVIGAPIASIVIVFELTGSYAWAVLSMISVVTASQLSRAVVGRSLFDRQLALRGIRVDDDHPPPLQR